MKIYKDVVFAISVIFWLISNVTSYCLFGDVGTTISNFICMMLFGSLVMFKQYNNQFNEWLETPLK